MDKKGRSIRYSPISSQNKSASPENSITQELAYVNPQELSLFPIKIRPTSSLWILKSLPHRYFHHFHFAVLTALTYFAAHHALVQELLCSTDKMSLVAAWWWNKIEEASKIIPGTLPEMKWYFMALFPAITYKPIGCHDFSVKPFWTGK